MVDTGNLEMAEALAGRILRGIPEWRHFDDVKMKTFFKNGEKNRSM